MVAIPRIQQRKKRDRNRLDVFGKVALGRHLQQGNETAHAAARFQKCEQRYLSCWSRQYALAEGYGKIGRSSFGIESRRGRPREFCLPNHCFNLKYLLQAGSPYCFKVVFASGGRHVTSRHPTLDTVGPRSALHVQKTWKYDI